MFCHLKLLMLQKVLFNKLNTRTIAFSCEEYIVLGVFLTFPLKFDLKNESSEIVGIKFINIKIFYILNVLST